MNFDKFDLDKLKFWEEKKEENALCTVLAVVGILAIIAGAAYFVYKFFTPDYLEDLDDDEEFYFDDEE